MFLVCVCNCLFLVIIMTHVFLKELLSEEQLKKKKEKNFSLHRLFQFSREQCHFYVYQSTFDDRYDSHD